MKKTDYCLMKEKSLPFFLYFWKAHKNQMCFTWLEIIRKIFLATFVGPHFFLVGQCYLCLNKSGQCSKSIFSYTLRGFDPIPRLKGRPKCQFKNSTEILCHFLCFFLKTHEVGRSPKIQELATLRQLTPLFCI